MLAMTRAECLPSTLEQRAQHQEVEDSLMPRNQEAQTPRKNDPDRKDQQQGGDRGTGRSTTDATASANASSGSRGVQGSEPRADQPRQVEMSRERGGAGMQSTGAGAQQSPSRQGSSRGAVAGRGQPQPSILPALMANPDLMTRAFMSNPYALAELMSQEMDRLFTTAGGDLMTPGRQLRGGGARGRGTTQWIPAMEVRQRENELVVHADLPGLTPDDVNIELEDGVLTISGERHDTSDDRNEGYVRSERSYGAFSRSIALPDGVDEEQVNARFEHGVLEVTIPLPRQQQQIKRRVPINAGGAQQSGGRGASDQQRDATR
jgi:HSP20 family protein